MSKPYVCAACSGVFISPRPESAAVQEAKDLFGEDPKDGQMEEVCDDCFKAMMAVVAVNN